MLYLLCGLLCVAQAERNVEADFAPQVRFLFKNPTNTTVTVHTAVVSVERAWVFRPLVPPQAAFDAPEVVTMELDPRKFPLTLRRSIARKIAPNDVDRVHFHFKLKPWDYERDGMEGEIGESDAVVFACRMKLLYGQYSESLDSGPMLIFIKNFGSGFDVSITRAVELDVLMGASREVAEAKINARAGANRKGAQEVAQRIQGGAKYNNSLNEFLDVLLKTR